MGRPVIAILNTWSDHQPCHAHLRERGRGGEARRLAGGRLSRRDCRRCRLGEVMVKPTTMIYRNFLAMEAEELLRSLPGRRRGAAGRLRQDHARRSSWARISMDLPAIFMPGRPDAATAAGAGKTARRRHATRANTGTKLRAGNIDRGRMARARGTASTRSPGTCMTMGTASTMTSIVEAHGPDAARARPSIPGARFAARAHGLRLPARASSRWSGRT